MTTPAPLPPLLTQERLAVWTQERPLLDPEFADLVIDAVSTLVRQYGQSDWLAETMPARARDIGYVVARNYYLNPGLLRSETTGPITETRAEAVLQGIELTESQKAELAGLASAPTGEEGTLGDAGLWGFSTTRGPVEMVGKARPGNVVVWDTRYGWPVEYLDPSEAVVFVPESEV